MKRVEENVVAEAFGVVAGVALAFDREVLFERAA
jgi:hypothetical protein